MAAISGKADPLGRDGGPAQDHGKEEWRAERANSRFAITNFRPEEYTAQALYEQVYCTRGNMENRTQELKPGPVFGPDQQRPTESQPVAVVVGDRRLSVGEDQLRRIVLDYAVDRLLAFPHQAHCRHKTIKEAGQANGISCLFGPSVGTSSSGGGAVDR